MRTAASADRQHGVVNVTRTVEIVEELLSGGPATPPHKAGRGNETDTQTKEERRSARWE